MYAYPSMKKYSSRSTVPSLYKRYFEKGVRRLRSAFLRSRSYQLLVDLHRHSGVRDNISLIVDELKIRQIKRIWHLAKAYFREVRRRCGAISHVVNDIHHALEEIAAECRSPHPTVPA
jgi:hypothetical protein